MYVSYSTYLYYLNRFFVTWRPTSRHDIRHHVIFSHEKGDEKTECRMTVFIRQKWRARKFIRQLSGNWFSSVIWYEMSPDSAYKWQTSILRNYDMSFRQYFFFQQVLDVWKSFSVHFSADLTGDFLWQLWKTSFRKTCRNVKYYRVKIIKVRTVCYIVRPIYTVSVCLDQCSSKYCMRSQTQTFWRKCCEIVYLFKSRQSKNKILDTWFYFLYRMK